MSHADVKSWLRTGSYRNFFVVGHKYIYIYICFSSGLKYATSFHHWTFSLMGEVCHDRCFSRTSQHQYWFSCALFSKLSHRHWHLSLQCCIPNFHPSFGGKYLSFSGMRTWDHLCSLPCFSKHMFSHRRRESIFVQPMLLSVRSKWCAFFVGVE